MIPKLVGVLNLTPDSFSDGGEFLEPEKALEHARKLIGDGAALVEIGGDSTRPGSVCVGASEEWRRIEPVARVLQAEGIPYSVDTHQAEVGRQALALGALMINDVSGGRNLELLSTLKGKPAKVVLMYSRCNRPHEFSERESGDILHNIKNVLKKSAAQALACGLTREQIILDPGMGAFLSDDPSDSFSVAERFGELQELGFPLMLAASRKGFLRAASERSPKDRDAASVALAKRVWIQSAGEIPQYIRAHEIRLHRQELR